MESGGRLKDSNTPNQKPHGCFHHKVEENGQSQQSPAQCAHMLPQGPQAKCEDTEDPCKGRTAGSRTENNDERSHHARIAKDSICTAAKMQSIEEGKDGSAKGPPQNGMSKWSLRANSAFTDFTDSRNSTKKGKEIVPTQVFPQHQDGQRDDKPGEHAHNMDDVMTLAQKKAQKKICAHAVVGHAKSVCRVTWLQNRMGNKAGDCPGNQANVNRVPFQPAKLSMKGKARPTKKEQDTDHGEIQATQNDPLPHRHKTGKCQHWHDGI